MHCYFYFFRGDSDSSKGCNYGKVKVGNNCEGNYYTTMFPKSH